MVKLIQLTPVAFITVILFGCAVHQDLLAPANTGPMTPINTYWEKHRTAPAIQKPAPTQDQ